jgi:hypothetical protein
MNAYIKNSVTVEFESDRVLTESEIDTLKSIIALQLEEPQDLEGNEETWTANHIAVFYSVIVRREDR